MGTPIARTGREKHIRPVVEKEKYRNVPSWEEDKSRRAPTLEKKLSAIEFSHFYLIYI
jgi:hypothetical protein